MFVEDEIISSLDRIVSGEAGFVRNSYFQVNGQTVFTDIEQIDLTSSKFSFNYANQRILHFTNLEALRLILNSKSLRASNLNRFDDKLELIHALNLGDIDSEFITFEKAYKFALSFTRSDRPIEEKEFHWKNYANNFKGAALEFEVDSSKLPFNFFSLDVNYFEDAEESDLISKIAKMQLSPVALKALIPIFCAVKRKGYFEEEEVRIFLNGDKNVIESIHYGDKSNYTFQLDKDNNISYFNMVPILFADEDSEYDKFLRLKKIYLGKNSNINFGQQFMLRHIYDFCDNHGIEWEDLAWK